MFHGREESVKNTNVARDKRMSMDSSPKLEHAAWQDGARPPLSHRPRTRPPRVETPRGRLHQTVRSMMGFSWFLTRSSIQVQAWPVHQASFTKQIADRHSRPLHSRSRLPPVVSHPAEGRQTSCSPFPAFPSALARFSRPQKADPARPGPVSLPAESPLSSRLALASKATTVFPFSFTSFSRPLRL